VLAALLYARNSEVGLADLTQPLDHFRQPEGLSGLAILTTEEVVN
jgi:hypothetical protein